MPFPIHSSTSLHLRLPCLQSSGPFPSRSPKFTNLLATSHESEYIFTLVTLPSKKKKKPTKQQPKNPPKHKTRYTALLALPMGKICPSPLSFMTSPECRCNRAAICFWLAPKYLATPSINKTWPFSSSFSCSYRTYSIGHRCKLKKMLNAIVMGYTEPWATYLPSLLTLSNLASSDPRYTISISWYPATGPGWLYHLVILIVLGS